ncbi:5-methyltetrahydropteroyltriglutamate--homocysteine S-methyltransferase [Nocardiopsis coralliicola]
MVSTAHGYPRIGPDRELKKACESYWAGRIGAAELDAVGARLRRGAWEDFRAAGIGAIPSNTFSYYDHMLDAALLFGAVPERFGPAPEGDREAELAHYFTLARGTGEVPPLEMTKWFDTNYHYLVPELGPQTRFRLAGTKPIAEFTQARGLGFATRPVLVGPLTFLALSKPDSGAPGDWSPFALLDGLVAAYRELLAALANAGAEAVQLDEPILATDEGRRRTAELSRAYTALGALGTRPEITVSTYFGSIGTAALEALKDTAVERIGLDLVAGPEAARELAAVSGLGGKALVAGVVDGRNVWRTDVAAALATLTPLLGLAREVDVSTSCSLLHVPVDLEAETGLDPALKARLAFARQKLDEVALLAGALDGGGSAGDLARAREPLPEPAGFRDPRVRARLAALGSGTGRAEERRGARGAGLPPLPTTTIGSFPQTEDIRKARAEHRAGSITGAEYEARMRAEIDSVIALQEDIGLDVLVHGEPERNDMVQYFAERLGGFTTTAKGWVQSYGSRCVRPPILYGDVNRPAPMTVEWARYAQSRTDKPVKGMLTGPVTILAWSFVRGDQPLAETARQVALALRDEMVDLEQAGIRHIQVDEAALRELLPLREEERQEYLDWAVGSFRLATGAAGAGTTVHTHMCYSEFGTIVGAIEALGADVTSVEAARSRMELVGDLERSGYRRGIGPGVYDIHSPRVPSTDEVAEALRTALQGVPPDRLWVNPDCGLKTRGYAEAEPALRNMVAAAQRVRAELAD